MSRSTSIASTRKNLRSRSVLRIAAAATSAVAALSSVTAPARAASPYWDGDGVGTVGGGSGVWDLALQRWSAAPAGSTYDPFTPGDSAFFGGTAGFVQVGTNAAPTINANDLFFNTSDYVLMNPSAATGEINLATGVIDTSFYTANIHARIGGTDLRKEGIGVLYFHAANNYTGATVINGGTLALANTAVADIPNNSAVQIADVARLDLSRNGQGAYSDTVGSLDGAGEVRFGSTPTSAATVASSSLTVGGDNSSTVFSGELFGANGRFTKTGFGNMTLSGTNTITGSMTVNAGTLRVENAFAVEDGTPVFVNPLFDSGGSLLAAGTLELGNSEVIGGLGGGFATGTPNLVNLNGNDLTVNPSRNIAYNGVITGNGNLIKLGSAIQQLANANSNFVGSVTVTSGILIASRDLSLGAISNDVTLNGGTLSNFPVAGVSYNAGRDFTITAANGGINVLQAGTASLTSTIPGIVSGPGRLTKGGPGRLDLTGANTFSGGMVVEQGTIGSTRASGTPFGTGSLEMKTGFIVLNPAGTGGATIAIASDPAATMTYGPGTQMQVNRGNHALFQVRIGDPAAVSSSLVRSTNGTMTLLPNSLANLGNPAAASRDEIYVNGGVPLINGIASPSIVSWQSTGGSQGDYLTYGANGFALATYNGGPDINTAAANSVFKAAIGQVLSDDRTVYALNAHTQAFTLGDGAGGYQLRIGDGVNPAGMIMNIGAAINPGPVGTSSLYFDGPEAVIYTQNTAVGAINVPLFISGNNGLVKFGYGSLTLNQPAGYSGPTVIGQGLISLGVNDALPTITTVNLMGHPASTNTTAGANYPTLKLNAFNQTIAALQGDASVARVDLGAGTLTVDQATDTTYAGVVTGINTGATQGTLHKTGAGTLTLGNVYVGPVAGTAFPNLYSRLRLTGGTLSVASTNSLPAQVAGTFAPDAITIDNNARLRWTGVNTLDSNIFPTSSLSQTAGVTLGAGGGTIEVTNPNETLILQDVGVQSTDPLNPNFNRRNAVVHDITGPGDLTKTGPGTLRLYANAQALDFNGGGPAPIANSYEGKTRVLGGILQFNGDGALGQAPGALVADQLLVSGGTIQSTGAVDMAPTRGITIGAGGAGFHTTSSLAINSPITGSGAITKTGGNTLSLFASSPSFSGGMTLTDGQTFFNTDDAAGTGAVVISPAYPVVFGKVGGPGNTILANQVLVQQGAKVDVRVDNVAGADTLTLTGQINGANNLYKSAGGASAPGAGQGTLVLTNSNNAFSGNLIIQTGAVIVEADHTLGGSVGHTIITEGGTLGFRGGFTFTAPETIVLAGGTLSNIAGVNRFGLGAVLAAGSVINTDADSLELGGGIVGAANLTKTGVGSGDDFKVQHVRANDLNVTAGRLTIAPNSLASGVSTVAALTIANGAHLDLKDNKIITTTMAGTATGGVYDGVQGMVQSARNGGAWDGDGLTTSMPDALSGLTTIGVSTGEEVANLGATDTGNFAGQTITAASTIAMYTYAGDANLDGQITGDDYSVIDFNIAVPGADGYYNGDFNYDGIISGDDYSVIDFNIVAQGAPFPAGGSADGVTAVPEPSACGFAIAAGAALAARRHRRNSRT